MQKNRILHLFQWKHLDIIDFLPKIKEQNFDSILLTPIQECKDNGDEWWKYYQPYSFKVGNNIGNVNTLAKLVEEAHKYNIKIYQDIIITHFASSNNPMEINEKVDKSLLNNNFWKQRKAINNWNDRYQVTNFCHGLPCTDLKNLDYQKIVFDFMNYIIDNTNIDGFRIDSGKSISLPDEDNNTFFNNIKTLHNFNNLNIFTEVIFMDKWLLNLYSKYTNVLTDSFCDNKEKIIAFIESHDTFLNQSEIGYTRKMNDQMIINEYDVLCKEYKNTLFYARPFNNTWMNNRIKNINSIF